SEGVGGGWGGEGGEYKFALSVPRPGRPKTQGALFSGPWRQNTHPARREMDGRNRSETKKARSARRLPAAPTWLFIPAGEPHRTMVFDTFFLPRCAVKRRL